VNVELRFPPLAHPRRNMPNNAIRINLILGINYFLVKCPDVIKMNLLLERINTGFS